MTVIYILGLALVHVLAGSFRSLSIIPRSRWLSAAGGVAVSYVFVHILPELAELQRSFARSANPLVASLESHVYLLALIGLAFFYGLEHYVKVSHREADRSREIRPAGVFWTHVASFWAYNALIGYLLSGREPLQMSTFFFFFAMAVHFLTNDYGLWLHHRQLYSNWGRWLLASGVFVGWGIRSLMLVSDIWFALLFSVLAGGVVLNVMKEELPDDRESSFWAFASGAALYAAILIAI